jgi:hypothetical protein
MKYIVITSVPPGQAPLWVRQKWVGISIPLIENPREGLKQKGVLGGTPKNSAGYNVSAAEAINRLKQVAPDAAKWWENHLPLVPSCELVFARGVCQISEIPQRK